MSASPAELEAIWHDVECGAYAADLASWAELAAAAPGPVLELGAGTGRVALHLAAAGHEVVALDTAPALLAELRDRAAGRGLEVETIVADARELDTLDRAGPPFGAILAPMQLVHLLAGPDGRRSLLDGAAGHLAPGGVLAAALLADDALVHAAGDASPLLPDVREVDGWVYSSQPLEVATTADGIEIRRLRQTVSPAGDLTDEPESVHLEALTPEELEAEAAASGLTPRERIEVPATDDHVGSTICVLEAGR
jgi:SAM-dependent methyltransferase